MPGTDLVVRNARTALVAAPKLLDRVRLAVRVRHYSRRTEEAYVTWVRRYVLFHGKRHPSDLGPAHVAAFLSSLATAGRVSASTQNQALSALTFLYRIVLRMDLGDIPSVVRAHQPPRLPVVLDRNEVRAVLAQLKGTVWLVAALLYGAGLRLNECLELRVKDVDFAREQIVVRRGKGQKDRATVFPEMAKQRLVEHLQELLGHRDVSTTMTYLHVIKRGALGVKSPADRL